MLELLNQLYGFDSRADVKVILATNKIESLEPALLHPGRINRKIEFPLPDINTRWCIFQAGYLHLVKPYMVAVQSNNVSAVNEALNEIYVEEEDYDRLRESIDLDDNFDQIGLAQKIEKHELLEMRRVAAYICKKAGRWKQSIALSKKDKMYKDAMETCSQSGDRELSEELLVYFIEQKAQGKLKQPLNNSSMPACCYYDIRKQCEGSLCYDFSNMEKILNQKSVRDSLGVGDIDFVSCSSSAYQAMLTNWMRNLGVCIPALLEDGIKMLVYAGEYDLICNWLGFAMPL